MWPFVNSMTIMDWQFFLPVQAHNTDLGLYSRRKEGNNIIVLTYVSLSSTEQNESVYKIFPGTQVVWTVHHMDMIQQTQFHSSPVQNLKL